MISRGQRARLEPVGDVRQDPFGGERPHRVAEQALLVGELVIDVRAGPCSARAWAWRFLSSLQIRVFTGTSPM